MEKIWEKLWLYDFPKNSSQGGFAGRTFLGKVVRASEGDSHVLFQPTHIGNEAQGGSSVCYTKLKSHVEVRVPRDSLYRPEFDVKVEE